MPQSVIFNAFSVLGTQNTRDLGTRVPKTQGYPNHCDSSTLYISQRGLGLNLNLFSDL